MADRIERDKERAGAAESPGATIVTVQWSIVQEEMIMDHIHTPEDDANEERTVEKKRHWGILESVDKAVSGIFTPHPEQEASSEDKAHLRKENDAEQRS